MPRDIIKYDSYHRMFLRFDKILPNGGISLDFYEIDENESRANINNIEPRFFHVKNCRVSKNHIEHRFIRINYCNNYFEDIQQDPFDNNTGDKLSFTHNLGSNEHELKTIYYFDSSN